MGHEDFGNRWAAQIGWIKFAVKAVCFSQFSPKAAQKLVCLFPLFPVK